MLSSFDLGPRPSRPRWRSRSRGTIAPQPQARSRAEDGGRRFFAWRCKAGPARRRKKASARRCGPAIEAEATSSARSGHPRRLGVPADGPRGDMAAHVPTPRETAAQSVQRPVPTSAKATETSGGTERRGFGHRRCNGSPLRHPAEASGPTPSPRFGCGAVEVRQHVMSHSTSQTASTPSVGGRRPAVRGARVVEAIRERSAPWLGRQRRPSSNEDPRAVEYSDGAAGDRDERHARPGGSRPPWAVEHSDGAAGNRPVWPRPGRTAWMREGSSPKGRDAAGGSVEPGAPGRLAQ